MSNLIREAKQVADISLRFLPNPKVLNTVLLWTVAFMTLLNGVTRIFGWDDYYYYYQEWMSVFVVVAGTAVIVLEKPINRAEDPIGLRFCAMTVAGVLGVLIQLTMYQRLFALLLRIAVNWILGVFGGGFGLLYAIPCLAEMVQKRAAPSIAAPAEPTSGLKQQAKQVTEIMARWLPNPNLLCTVLLWTVGFVNVFYAVFGIEDWTSIIALFLGTVVIGLEKFINRVEEPVLLRCFTMFVAGFLGFLIQIIMNLYYVLIQVGIVNYNYNETELTAMVWVSAVFCGLFGLLYAMASLMEMVENRA